MPMFAMLNHRTDATYVGCDATDYVRPPKHGYANQCNNGRVASSHGYDMEPSAGRLREPLHTWHIWGGAPRSSLYCAESLQHSVMGGNPLKPFTGTLFSTLGAVQSSSPATGRPPACSGWDGDSLPIYNRLAIRGGGR